MLQPRLLRRFMLLSGFALVVRTYTVIAVDGQAQSYMRSLSAANTRADRNEEKMLNTFAAKVAWEVEKLAPSLRLRFSRDKEKAISYFFENFHVESVKKNLFASKQYRRWASGVLGTYKDSPTTYMALFQKLKKHFNDYELATFVLDGLASPKTKAVAENYYDLQMKDWIENKEALDVFRALKLDVDRDNVLKNPLLETYVSFVRQLSRTNNLDDQPIYDDLYRMLEQKFGVARLAEMLGATNVDLREDKVGGGVMNALFRDIASKGPKGSLEYVESTFKDNAVGESSAVSIWLSYAKRSLSQSDYEKLVTGMINDLLDQRGVKDKALATVIAAAQKDESTRKLATDGLEKLLTKWEEHKKKADDVLNILGLEVKKMKAEDIEKSPLLETWFAFESRQHADDAKLLVALQKQLSDEQLASMLVIEMGDPKMAIRLYKVRKALFKDWQMEGIDEDAAFQRFQLHRAGDKLFAHPALSVWHSYVLEHYGPGSSAKPIVRVVKKHYDDPKLLLAMVRRVSKLDKHTSTMIIAEMLKQKRFAHSRSLRTSQARQLK